MPEPQAHPELPRIKRVAINAIFAGIVLMLTKFVVFGLTNSAAVLTDALESIINIAAAALMLWTIILASRPADREHPYGHGKAEFMAVGFEGWLILLAALFIAYEGIKRLFIGAELRLEVWHIWMLGILGLFTLALALYVYRAGKRYDSAVLIADGKHLLTDFASTVGVLMGLMLVHFTGWQWLDPIVAIVMAAFILYTSWTLLWQSISGLMDRTDPADDATIREILDDELQRGHIRGYHKVRHRHNGPFHWVDMHLQVDGDLSVQQSHDLASAIERRIELRLGQANATAHVEPLEPFTQTNEPAAPQAEPPTQLDEPPRREEEPPRQLDEPPRREEEPPRQEDEPPRREEKPPRQSE